MSSPASPSLPDVRFAISRFAPEAPPTSRASAPMLTPTLSRSARPVRFPGTSFPPHRTGLRALWKPTLVDRLQTPLTRYHE